jgi:hypothetical protein
LAYSHADDKILLQAYPMFCYLGDRQRVLL